MRDALADVHHHLLQHALGSGPNFDRRHLALLQFVGRAKLLGVRLLGGKLRRDRFQASIQPPLVNRIAVLQIFGGAF